MAQVDAIRDENRVAVVLGVSSTDATETVPITIDSTTWRVLCEAVT